MGSELDEINRTLGAHTEAIDEMKVSVGNLAEIMPEIRDHITREDEHKDAFAKSFARGEIRMDKIEEDLAVLHKLLSVFEGFTKSFKVICYLGGAIMAMFLWILFEKNSDIKLVQDTLLKHTVTLERLVVSHAELERDFNREVEFQHGPGRIKK